MAKQSNKIQNYSEADLVELFELKSLQGNNAHAVMQEWMATPSLSFEPHEKIIFEAKWKEACKNIRSWNEEELKMQFIAFILMLGHLENNGKYFLYFERTVSATINGHFLKTKTDFMMAKGILDKPKQPYFHFQEWKPQKNPTGDSMAQLLEAMLIAQELNGNSMPIYGCEVVGKSWVFVTLEKDTYCTSKTYDCTEYDELQHIVAVLRHFKHILETRLLD